MDITCLNMSFVITALLTTTFLPRGPIAVWFNSSLLWSSKTAPCFSVIWDIHSICLKDWDREKLLEAWMSNPENCCYDQVFRCQHHHQVGITPGTHSLLQERQGQTRSSVTSPDELSLSPGDLDTSSVRFCTQCTSQF